MLLSEIEIQTKLKELDNWILHDSKIIKEFQFHTFSEVVGFYNTLAAIAIKLNHHPEFFNAYKFCKVGLITHDFNGLTQLDFDFAKEVDAWMKANAAS